MRLSLLILALLLSYSSQAQAQKQPLLHFGDRLIAGTSLTFIFHRENEFASGYKEFTWNKNIAINLNKSIYLGLSFLNIYTSGSSYRFTTEKENHFMFGSFLQYDFLPNIKNRLFAEASWHTGNYCTCLPGDPSKKEDLHYLGVGLGYDLPIARQWSLDLSFMFYNILNRLEGKDNYTQYVIGINYDLVK